MKITFVTLFKDLVSSYFMNSILGKAFKNGLLEIEFLNPRDYSKNKHLKVDDYQVSGGAGLLMSTQPLFDLLSEIKKLSPEAKIIFPAPAGKVFKQNDAKRLSFFKHLVFVCGRYEGIDERIFELFADEVFGIGDYILTGGELASMVMSDAILRNIEGVLGNKNSLLFESFEDNLLEPPAFTKPARFYNINVPSDFLKGNHNTISDLKNKMSICKTRFHRPDLYISYIMKH